MQKKAGEQAVRVEWKETPEASACATMARLPGTGCPFFPVPALCLDSGKMAMDGVSKAETSSTFIMHLFNLVLLATISCLLGSLKSPQLFLFFLVVASSLISTLWGFVAADLRA